MNRLRSVVLAAGALSALTGLTACGVQAEDEPVTITTAATSTETPSLQTSVCPPGPADAGPPEPGSPAPSGRSAAAGVVTPVGCATATATSRDGVPGATPSPTPSS